MLAQLAKIKVGFLRIKPGLAHFFEDFDGPWKGWAGSLTDVKTGFGPLFVGFGPLLKTKLGPERFWKNSKKHRFWAKKGCFWGVFGHF